ncbi:MAG TPA: DPP IV N-terminal domain-containing protein [Kofleriaceae bacterium]|nr:DPP IV N-terminal domain-containing protein [Kofleriaceae bacterium]
MAAAAVPTRRPSAGLAACAALAALVLAAGPRRARAGDPSMVWRTIETEHFEVHYHEPLGDVARRVAVSAERAHATLSAALRHSPSGKTHIVLEDDTDGTNGFASVVPRNRIVLFASAPPDTSALADTDNWLYNLTSHEYTHVVHLDTIGGLPAVVNRLMGKVWAPNQAQPRWVIEGLATYEESKRSASGRTRNALFDTYLRVATLEENDRRLDEVSTGPRGWPHANAAYLYGSYFLKYVFDRHGDDKAAAMSHDYGSSAIPYGLNRSIERVTGRSFVDLYGEWRAYREARYGLEAEAVERRGRREGRRLTFTGENNLNPHYTADGRAIVWQRGDGYSLGQFRTMPVGDNAGRSSTYVVLERTGQFDMLGDGSMVVEQTASYRTSYEFQELFRWDRASGAMTMLTHGMRVSDPAVSPDEAQVAFVMNGRSRRQLAVIPNRPEARARVVWSGESRFDQAFSPDWSPDGRRIAFSAWREGGTRDILVVDVATGAVRQLVRDRALDVEPAWSPDGRYLYFSSDRTGIYNVYAWELATDRLWQVTDVIGCALGPEVSPDGRRMVYQGFAADGNELYEIELDPASWTEAPPAIDDRPDPVVIGDDEFAVSAPRPYRPLETLAPTSYEIGLVVNSLGQALDVRTFGDDVVGHHHYDLVGTVGLDYRGVNVGGSYSYRRLWPSIGLTATRAVAKRGGYIVDGVNLRFDEEALRATLGVGLPVFRAPDASSSLSVDYDVDWLRNLDGALHENDPNDPVPRVPETDLFLAGLALRWGYSDTKGFTYTLGPQYGKDLGASLRVDHPSLGSAARSLTLTYRATWFRQIPLPSVPAVMVRLTGGLRTTDRPRVEQFALGGVPDSQDLVRSLIDNVRAGSTGYLRGFPPRFAVGQQYHLANVEVRQELWDIERGISTLPFYLRRLHVAALADAGNAFEGEIDASEVKVGVGAALRLDFTLGYLLPGSLDLGYARGVTRGGIGETWLLLTGTI